MIKNYFKTALRSLMRNRNYMMINIAGLAAGIAVCLVIFIIIRYHSSFDEFHTKKDRIYRVLTEYHHADAPDIFYGKGVPTGLPQAIKSNFPQLEKVASIYSEGNDQILVPDENGQPVKKFKEANGVYFTEPSFFDIFDYKWLAGTPAVLANPGAAVLTKETAERYFGNWQAAVGKKIKWNNNTLLQISGVLDNIPPNTDLHLKVVAAMGSGYTAEILTSKEWNNTGSSFGCYVLLPQNLNAASFNPLLRAYAKRMKEPDNKDSQILEALGEVHYSPAGNFSGKTISPELIKVLWLIAAFILLIACVNFINLATAQAVNRSKEVGVRKVMGSNRRQLKLQFLTETLMIVTSAVILSVALSFATLPAIGRMLELPLTVDIVNYQATVLFLFVLTIVVTLLAGFYPSVVLAGFNPIEALKSKMDVKNIKGVSLRRGLVTFQFIIAQALIIGTIIIVKQMNYFTTQPLGFNKEAIINVPFPGDSAGVSRLDFLRRELLSIQGIQNVSFSSNTPIEDNNDNWTKFNYDHAVKETDFYAINKGTDDQYLPVYKLPLLAGRNFQPSDTVREFIVNESLVNKLGVHSIQDVLNKDISLWDGQLKGKIVGVLKDFHNRSFRAPVAPLLMTTTKNWYSVAGIKLTTRDAAPAIRAVEKIWNNIYPDFAFEFKFLDEKVENFYKQEYQLSLLYKVFAVIAIFLSCLGLYGLVSFMAVQRVREVGIRKVLGATPGSIVYLFSREFMFLIGIAFLIASPLAWYFMGKWLQDYPYRINISLWIFVLGGVGSVIIALITVSFQAVKAAMANPAKSLRSE